MKITGTAIKLGIFSLVLLLFTAIIIVVFGQMRFDRTTSYNAIFSNVSGLRAGQFVRAAGVEVGLYYVKGAPFDATQNRGMAILLNYTAPQFPGGPVTIQYVKPGETAATPIDLRAAVGAVSFRTVVVN